MALVEFFYDFVSPYSYLASTQIESLCARTGTDLSWRPVLLGAVLKAAGVAAPASIPAKAVYMLSDLNRWADEYGVPFRFPSSFPFATLKPLRAAIIAERDGKAARFSTAIFRVCWAEDRNGSTDEVLRACLTEAGLEPDAVLAATEQPEIKDALRRSTDEAVARGAFGAPTMFVGEEMFFGNDRLAHLETLLRGRSRL